MSTRALPGLSLSKILLILFILGSSSAFIVSAIGWWAIKESARQVDWLRNTNISNLEHASDMTMRVLHMRSHASDILNGVQPLAEGKDRLARDDAEIRTHIAYLKTHFRRDYNQRRIQAFSRQYERLFASQQEAIAWMETDPGKAKRLFREHTHALYEQSLGAEMDFTPGIKQSASQVYQEAGRISRQSEQAFLTAALFAGFIFALAAVLGRRFVSAHEQDKESLRLAAAVFDSSTEGIIITARDGLILQVNPAFSTITGYCPEEVIGRNPKLLSSRRQGAGFYRTLWQTLLTNGQWQGEVWNRRKNGEIYPERLSICSIRTPSGEADYFVATFSDITEHKRVQDKITYQAYHDALTNLPNRVLFTDRLEQSLAFARRLKHGKVAVLFVDLDRFKLVNDSLGHAVGDLLLQRVAQRLSGVRRQSDTLARLGGDEFTLLLPDVDHVEEAMMVADKVLAALKQPFVIDGRDIFMTVSIGISMYPDDGPDVESLMKHADTAMYRVKKQGRNGFFLYNQALDQHSLRRLELENQLHTALARQQLVLHYQPQFDLAEGRIRGVEALIRWQHPELGMISPAEFIPLAEESGLIVPIGAWVLETACKQAHAWREAGFPDLVMSVNLSVRQFFREDIVSLVARAIQDSTLPASVLELEITESVAMEDVAYTIKTLESLAVKGLRLAIDDFGTGYSSLSQLRKMPVGILKIDRSFVHDIATSPDAAAIVNAIITMAHRLGLKVIAEGVESQAQLAHLREQQCDTAQGFLFSRALPAAELEPLLREWDFSFRACDDARMLLSA